MSKLSNIKLWFNFLYHLLQLKHQKRNLEIPPGLDTVTDLIKALDTVGTIAMSSTRNLCNVEL